MSENRHFGTTGLFPQPLGKILEEVTDRAFRKRGFVQTRLLTHWPQIAGGDIAAKCSPRDVKFPPNRRRNGTLTLQVTGNHALEIQHSEAVILEKLAGYFGYRAIDRIKLVQVASAQKNPLDA